MDENKTRKPRTILAPEGMVDLKRAAAVAGYTLLALQQLCKAGKVPHTVRGNRYFFSEEDMKKILKHVEPKTDTTNEGH